MRQEVEGFSKVAPQYERGRPGYPAEAVDWIAAKAGLGPGGVVVDLAAGTGKLTRQLVRSGARVIAVEPLPEMLRELIAVLPQVEVVIGTAEATGLPDAVADVVAVGQAFHWFSTPAALSEIARLLVPGGHLALVWNRRDPTQALQAELDRIMARFRRSSPSYESGAWTEVMDRSTLFERVAERQFSFVQVLDADGLSDRVASTSFIANLEPGEQAAVLQQVRELVKADFVELAYACTVYLFKKR
ncbi:MAG TPA: methyltransferase domain-containing protein [Acidimicrobiales bacterium]|nr:methyltransferase domain-containing protein [Acidimicrobiales bacterium]